METELLIAHGNQSRADRNPEQALTYYAAAMIQDRRSASAFNNYGNVLREIGDPEGAIPFLQRAIQLDPDNVTSKFNLAVSYLLLGDYERGWPAYEVRWNYEHLAGTLPTFPQPRWTGQDLKDKTILVVGEQGHGDNIQFCRFVANLKNLGAKVLLIVNQSLKPLLSPPFPLDYIAGFGDPLPVFDYWIPIMSLPGVLNITLDKLNHMHYYILAQPSKVKDWQQRLGPKTRLRVGFCWSGRRDSWINQHKSLPFETMKEFIKTHPQYEWINLQVDCEPDEERQLIEIGVNAYPGAIKDFTDSAALITNLDVVVGVDTAVSHLSGALGRPTWIMLNQFALDWRWLLDRDSSPWYPTARLFRQPKMDDWDSVLKKISQYLSWFKI